MNSVKAGLESAFRMRPGFLMLLMVLQVSDSSLHLDPWPLGSQEILT